MLADIVIDTNVLVDAGNPGVIRQGDSLGFLNKFLELKTDLKVDPGDLIVSEYSDKLRAGTPGFAVLAQLAASNRIKIVPEMPSYNIRRKVIRIIRNRRDRTFLCVSIQTDGKIFVSHDFHDFHSEKRIYIGKTFGVDVLEAAIAQSRL